jgi:hypothetical protein
MLHLGSMMKSVVHKQVVEQVGRAMDRSGVLIDPNAETVAGVHGLSQYISSLTAACERNGDM